MKKVAAAVFTFLLLTSPVYALPYLSMDDIIKYAKTTTSGSCSGRISEPGDLVLVSVELRELYTVYIFNSDLTKFVAAEWPIVHGDGDMPTALTFGTVKDGKLTVTKRRAFDPVLDEPGPCPVIYPKGA